MLGINAGHLFLRGDATRVRAGEQAGKAAVSPFRPNAGAIPRGSWNI